MNQEYELFPNKLIEDLKYDVEALKKKLSEPDSAVQELFAEIEELKETVKELNHVFTEALQDIKEEDSAKILSSLQNKIDAVTMQNETIARGMVAISDKLEDFMKRSKPSQPSMIRSPTGIPQPSPPAPTLNAVPGAIPSPPTMGSPDEIPQPPEKIKTKRRGIFK